jgi:hypothetical protein
MATPNNRQKLAVINMDATTQTLLQNYLNLGYVIHQITNLAPFANKLLIVYYDPSSEE